MAKWPRIAVGCKDGMLRIKQISGALEEVKVPHGKQVTTIVYNPQGQIITGSHQKLRLVDAASGV